MNRGRRGWWVVSVVGTALLLAPVSSRPADRPDAQPEAGKGIAYELTPLVNQSPRLLRVVMRFEVPENTERVTVQMPVWSPGDYHVQNHAQYVRDLRAFNGEPDDARPLVVTRPDANSWEIHPADATHITLTYALPETPPGFFSENVQLQDGQVFVNGPAAYLYIVGRKDVPTTLTLKLPTGWQAETPLPHEKEEAVAPPRFTAPDYDTLADSPVVMAAPDGLTIREFTVNNVTHKAVYFGNKNMIPDVDAYTPTLRRVVEVENKIMGVTPYQRYDFLFDVGGRGGGLEHLNAARLALWPEADPRRLAPFVAHEFFHLWNVKRIRPRVLGPFDYVNPPKTRNLWFAEGVTEYYANIATRRAGLMTTEQFRNHWRRAIRALQRVPARLKVTADESSLRVWEADNSTGYGGLDYYQKGELIGLCLDLKIRHVTNNRHSLDDVMRALFKRCNPPKPGYGEDDLRAVVNEVAGQDLTAFYDLLARSTQEMPFAECLEYAGLDIEANLLPKATPEQLALRNNWLAGF